MRPILFFLLFSSLVFNSIAQDYKDRVKIDMPNSYNNFGEGANSVSAHYIFVVDISEDSFCSIIQSRLPDFIKSLPDNDWVTVIKLGPTDQTNPIQSTERISKIRNSIFSDINGLRCGTDGSDGLKMSSEVIKALTSPGTQKSVPFVFVFSDFIYYKSGTGYNKPGINLWDPLIRQYNAAVKDLTRGAPTISTIKFPYSSEVMNNSNLQRTGDYRAELNRIFGDLDELNMPTTNALESYFNVQRGKIYKMVLRRYMKEIAEKQNADLHLNSNGNEISLSGSNLVYDQIELDPSSKTLIASITKKSGLFSFFPPTPQDVKLSGTLKAPSYNKEITDFKDIPFKDQTVTIESGDSYIPWWLTDLIACVLLLLCLRLIWCLFPAALNGMITFTSISNSDAANFNFNSTGKKTVTLGYGQLVANDINLFGSEEFSLKLTAKRNFFKGKCIVLFPQKGELRGKKSTSVVKRNVKTLVKPSSKWSINGVDIRLPKVR